MKYIVLYSSLLIFGYACTSHDEEIPDDFYERINSISENDTISLPDTPYVWKNENESQTILIDTSNTYIIHVE